MHLFIVFIYSVHLSLWANILVVTIRLLFVAAGGAIAVVTEGVITLHKYGDGEEVYSSEEIEGFVPVDVVASRTGLQRGKVCGWLFVDKREKQNCVFYILERKSLYSYFEILILFFPSFSLFVQSFFIGNAGGSAVSVHVFDRKTKDTTSFEVEGGKREFVHYEYFAEYNSTSRVSLSACVLQ